MYSLYVIDCETTGTDPEKHDIIEVCFWRLNEPEGKVWSLKSVHEDTIEDGALYVNKHKREDITGKTQEGRDTYKDPAEVLPEIEMWIMEDNCAAEDRVIIGQNPMFDYRFLFELWRRSGDENEFPFGYWMEMDGKRQHKPFLIDTIDIAKLFDILLDKKRKAYNLGSLVKSFGVTKCTAHRADGDVKMTKELFEKMVEPLKSVIEENFSDCY